MPPEDIYRVSRYFFAFLGVLSVLSALGWLHAEKKSRRERLRVLPSAGTIGELMVLEGSGDLPPQTWFPVSREGVLGSVRSCDLVVPCPGVKAHHLDYCWRDGVGLIIRPRSGCEVLINGIRLDCRSDAAAFPLTHGSCLRVGQAVLRLQVLKALDHTYRSDIPESGPEPAAFQLESAAVPGSPGPYDAPAAPVSGAVPPACAMPQAGYAPVTPPPGVYPAPYPAPQPAGTYPVPVPAPQSVMDPVPAPSPERLPDPSASSSRRPRRSDRWKEDWSE